MAPFTFRREARWLMWLGLAVPVLAFLLAILWPAMVRWWGR
jgi:hypothetical protein